MRINKRLILEKKKGKNSLSYNFLYVKNMKFRVLEKTEIDKRKYKELQIRMDIVVSFLSPKNVIKEITII